MAQSQMHLIADRAVRGIADAIVRRDVSLLNRLLAGVENIRVPIRIFAGIPDNKRQRDTEKRVKAWQAQVRAGGRSAGYVQTHDDVAAAIWPGGIMKCDGHTRVHMWENGELIPPPSGTVNLKIHRAKTEEEVLDLYTYYDNKAAAETSSDVTAGAQRVTGITLTKPFFAKGGNTQALRNSYALLTGLLGSTAPNRNPNVRAQIPDERRLKELFMPVLAHLDRITPFESSLWQAQILTVAVAATVLDGTVAIERFFAPYSEERQHRQDEGERNAIGHLAFLRRDPKTFHHYSSSAEFENIQRVIRLYDEHKFRVDHSESHSFEMTGARGKFLMPRYAGSHKKVDLARFNIGPDAVSRRIARLHEALNLTS